jgi:multidrug transporter EmrE-like cation transporter
MEEVVSKPQTIPIILNLVAAILGAVGQWLYKIGGTRLGTVAIYKNWHLFVGMILFCVVMVLFVIAFKLGGRLSVVYPVYATTFIWGMMIAVWFDKEPWAMPQMFGVLLILAGVSMIAAFYPR